MKSNKSMVWGGLLLIFGTLWLFRLLGWLNVDWAYILPFWPILLIVAGLMLIVSRPNSSANGLVSLLITLAVIGGIANKTNGKLHRQGDWNFGWNDRDRDSNHWSWPHDDQDEETQDEDYLSEKKNQSGRVRTGNYSYDMDDNPTHATLNLEGGAGKFSLKGSTDQLFEASTKSNVVGFVASRTSNKLNKSTTVNLKMEEGKLSVKNGHITNEASIKLNPSPIWTVDMGLGAGKGDFDFSPFKVEKMKISTGVADMDIRLGSIHDHVQVDVEAGVASITFEVPQEMGCEVHLEGALNVKSMDDLEKQNNGYYRSPGFESATKKVVINFEGGLTKVKVKRY
ncbi:hypothetical protein CLV98_108143 [Dyadobacter jejuensis]|uniref:LiaF transmembrane domain-containing protein n=1 Tax=Dyadobacter jejuensis TaxID=1082580 RepID=A0A316AHQ7_9BACT|nr:hypothetical protein [Dyadobacter jejuensis]PWJ57223.1 hypothetical protein CLV98_108143 [Dyadobacter jejuensis]